MLLTFSKAIKYKYVLPTCIQISATQNNNVLESGQNQADCWSEKYRMSSREICLSWDYCEIQARVSFPAFQSRRVVWSTKRGLRSKQKIFQSCFWRPSKLWQPRLWLIQMDRFAFRIHYERAAATRPCFLPLYYSASASCKVLDSNNMLNSKVIAILESNSNYNHVVSTLLVT